MVPVTDSKLPDDGRLPRLTMIGPVDDCKRIRADLDTSPALATYKGQVLVQDYRPGDVMVAKVVPAAVLAAGLPCIYLQRPDGVVLWRENGYPGPAALATALRRTRPDYDPSKDPGTANPSTIAGLSPDMVYVGVFAIVIACVVWYVCGRPAPEFDPDLEGVAP